MTWRSVVGLGGDGAAPCLFWYLTHDVVVILTAERDETGFWFGGTGAFLELRWFHVSPSK